MELISCLKEACKIFIIGSVISCFMLFLLFNNNEQNESLAGHAKISRVGMFPSLFGESEAFSSSVIVDDQNQPSSFTTSTAPPLSTMSLMAPEPSIYATASLFSDELEMNMIVEAPDPSIYTYSSPLSGAKKTYTSSLTGKAPEPLTFTSSTPPPLVSMIITARVPSIYTSPSPLSTKMEAPTSSMAVVVEPPKLSTLSYSSPPPIANVVANPPENLYPIEKPNMTVGNDIQKPNVVANVRNFDKSKKKCNIFDGRWVYNPDVEPSYCPLKCPFIEEKMSCKKNGRPDMEYEKWVWEARDCNIPKLNGTDMVERFRNKRIVLVGDSLNRNMWESLACIVYSSIPYPTLNAQILYEDIPIKTFLKAKEDYNITVEFFWSPFLVELNKNHESGKRVLMLDKLSPNSEQWTNADIIIFNTGHHWTQVAPKKAWDSFEYRGKLIDNMPVHQAFKRGMKTWVNWVERNIDPKKTTVFYRSISVEHAASHYKQHCYTKTQPIMDESYKFIFPRSLVRVVESVLRGMKTQVNYLNVTKLTEYRIDAHPSIYRFNDWKIRTKNSTNKLAKPIIPDCGHWCLPGVPDTWNRLLYASLYFDNYGDVSSF